MPSRVLVRLALSGWLVLAAASETAAQPLPPPALASPNALVELILGQSHTLAVPRLERFLVGDPSLLSVEQVSPNTLKLIPQSFGRTFVHIWSAEGRKTVVVRIVPVRIPLAARERAIAADWRRRLGCVRGLSSGVAGRRIVTRFAWRSRIVAAPARGRLSCPAARRREYAGKPSSSG